MSNYGPQSAFLIVGGRDISGDSFNLLDRVEYKVEQANGLGDKWEEQVPNGEAMAILEAGGGFYDDRLLGLNEALVGQGQVIQEVLYSISGRSIGADVGMPEGVLAATFQRIAARDGLTKANGLYKVTGVYRRGQLVHALNSETANGDTKATSVDQLSAPRLPTVAITNATVANPTVITSLLHGLITGDVINIAGSTTTPTINGKRTVTVVDPNSFTVPVNVTVGGVQTATFQKLTSTNAVWDMHVPDLNLDGGTSVTVLGLHSADNSVFTTAVTFANVTLPGTAQRQTQVGNVNEFTAISWVLNGSPGSNKRVTPVVAVSR